MLVIIALALGLLISKFKQAGGLPFDVFKTLFDTTVWSVIRALRGGHMGDKGLFGDQYGFRTKRVDSS